MGAEICLRAKRADPGRLRAMSNLVRVVPGKVTLEILSSGHLEKFIGSQRYPLRRGPMGGLSSLAHSSIKGIRYKTSQVTLPRLLPLNYSTGRHRSIFLSINSAAFLAEAATSLPSMASTIT